MNFLTDNWQALAALFGTIGAYFTGKTLKKIDIKDKEASALQNMQVAYEKFTEQTNKQIDRFTGEMDRLTSEIDAVKKENVEQRTDLRALQLDNSKLHLEVSKLMIENNSLRKMVEELKSENQQLKAKRLRDKQSNITSA